MVRCKGFFPECGKLAKGGHIYTPRSQFWVDFWQAKYTESMKNMLVMLYPVLGQLGPKGGSWGGMERSSNDEEIPKMRKICTPLSQRRSSHRQTKYTEFMENMFLMFYQVLGSLGAEGGL